MFQMIIWSVNMKIRLGRLSRFFYKRYHSRKMEHAYSTPDLGENIKKLYDFCIKDRFTGPILLGCKINYDYFHNLFLSLDSLCCGRYANSCYVSVRSISFSIALKFLLYHYNGERFIIGDLDEEDSDKYVFDVLYYYFDEGPPGIQYFAQWPHII